MEVEEGNILRQRRNLVAMSCLLIIFDLAKVKVAKVGVLGTDLIVGDVRVLAISMWVVWTYFLLRYYQFWRLEAPHVSRAVLDMLQSYGSSYFWTKIDGGVNQPFLERSHWIRGWVIQSASYAGGKKEVVASVEVAAWRAFLWWIKAYIHTGLHTTHFTEHALPFVLAAATPVVAVLMKIIG